MIHKKLSQIDIPNKRDKVKFCDNILQYSDFLELEYSTTNDGVIGLVLPIGTKKKGKKSDNILLPGAPTSFRDDEPLIVDNTSKIGYNSNIASNLKAEIDKYFEHKNYMSFACINLKKKQDIVGVLNIDSDKVGFFGKTKEEKSEILQLIYPFACLISSIL